MKTKLTLVVICIFSSVLTSHAQVIAGGSQFCLTICSDGSMRSWGDNNAGQLGDNTIVDKNAPLQVHGTGNVGFFTGVIRASAGTSYSLTLKNTGTVWAWGLNNGVLGDDTYVTKYTPVQVHGVNNSGFLTNITRIASGDQHALAVNNSGALFTWGGNGSGQLGDGTTSGSKTPLLISSMTNVIGIAGGSNFSLVLKGGGTVWSSGSNYYGSLGNGTWNDSIIFGQVSTITSIIAVAAGSGHGLALKSDSTVWAWGWNGDGQLGDGTTSDRNVPVKINGLTGIVAVSAGGNHSLALKGDGTVWAWGSNAAGQLGDGSNTSSTVPVQVHGAGNVGFLTGITAVSCGGLHSVALKNNGTVWTWGYNVNGQLGDGTNTDKNVPVQPGGLCQVFISVNEVGGQKPLSVYPNPSSGIFKLEGIEDANAVEVYNILGECVLHYQIIKSPNHQIDLSDQPAGIYFIRVSSERGQSQQKVMKME